ncbi:MAG: PDZ domain-containing protein [Pirellulales bacterium]
MAARELNWFCACVLLTGTLVPLPMATAQQTPPAKESQSAPTTQQIDAWIAELDDNRYLVREQATRQLLESGEAALDPLLAAAHAERIEPADRAVWILRRLARSRDNDLAIAALERLVQLRGWPLIVEKAESELAERIIVACEQRLTPLGAELSVQYEQIDIANVVPLVQLRLGPQWKGTTADLKPVAQLRHQLHFRLEGAPVDDAAVRLFEEKEKLAFLQLRDTAVTPAAIDSLKQRHPGATVYVRNAALLGVSAENHANGVLVQHVQPGTAAATAGIVPGDIIATIDGHQLPDFDRLTVRIAQHQPGDTIDVEVIRGEERKKLSVKLGSWAEQG